MDCVFSISVIDADETTEVQRIIIIMGLLMFTVVASAATLEQEMSKREFGRAGLEKLDAEELAYLNRYLGREALEPEVSFGREQLEDAEPVRQFEKIVARIKGEFDGWDGHTRFRLDNGQIWEQRVSGTYRHHATDPEVTVERGRFGYYLTITGSKRRVGVKRIK